MAMSVISSLHQISYLQQRKRKTNIEDYGFEEPRILKKIKIRYTPLPPPPVQPLVSFAKDEEKQVLVKKIRIKLSPSSKPPVPPLISNQRSTTAVVKRIKIKITPSLIPPPPPLISNQNNGLVETQKPWKSGMQTKLHNQRENNRLVQLNKFCGNLMKNKLLRQKKLCLVLDLDHTLLHSVKISEVSFDDQEYLIGRARQITCMKTVGRHNLYNHKGRYTRLRPYVRNFIEEVCGKFELYVYTMGERCYAEEMVRLIDPKSVYFQNKVISKDDSTDRHQKNLDVVLGGRATNTIIIDDTEAVWKQHRDNMIRINKFRYFSSRKHLLNMNDDEFDDDDSALKAVLEVLQRVHEKFFEEYPTETDVRPVLKSCLEEVSADS